MLNPDLSQTEMFLDCLDPNGVFTFQTFDDSPNKDYRKARVFHGTLSEHEGSLIRMNQSGAGVFVMVNEGDGIIHAGKTTCRCNENVIRVRAQFVDADGVPIEPILAGSPPPHIIVESSPGKWHVYWLTNDTKLEEFKAGQVALAEKFGTDPAVKLKFL